MKNRILYGSGALAALVAGELLREREVAFSLTWIIPTETADVEGSLGFLLDDWNVLKAAWETWGTGPSEKRKRDTLFRDHLLRSAALRGTALRERSEAMREWRNVEVVAIDPAKKSLRLESGEQLAFDELYWAGPADRLRKLGNVVVPVAKEGEGYVGLSVHLVAERRPDTPPVEPRRIFLGFKFRSEPYAAVGVRFERSDGRVDTRLVLPLLLEDAQDREELAKLATALRREAGKRLDALGLTIVEHQFQFLPALFAGVSRKVRSPEVAPGLFFLGPEIVCDDSLISAPATTVCRDNTLRALETASLPNSRG